MYNQQQSNFPGSNIPNSTMPDNFPGSHQQGLSQQTNILTAPQGEVSGLLGPGIPQNLGTHLSGTGIGAGQTGGKIKGTIIFRPIEARFNKDKDLIGKMNPYCKFKIGFHTAKSSIATSEGVNPTWNETVPLKYKGQAFAKLKVKDKDRLKPDSNLGHVKIPLDQIVHNGPTTQWYPLEKMGGKTNGEIHVETSFQPFGTTGQNVHGTTGNNVTGTTDGHNIIGTTGPSVVSTTTYLVQGTTGHNVQNTLVQDMQGLNIHNAQGTTGHNVQNAIHNVQSGTHNVHGTNI